MEKLSPYIYIYIYKYWDCILYPTVPNSAVYINHVSISPYPPSLSNGFSITYDAGSHEVIDDDVDVKLTLKAKIGFLWVTIPCIKDIGSWWVLMLQISLYLLKSLETKLKYTYIICHSFPIKCCQLLKLKFISKKTQERSHCIHCWRPNDAGSCYMD